MPLEMFDGKTGQRLIARLPVERGSYALVTTDEVVDMAVYHPEGLMINGYPAFSPVIGSLPQDISSPIAAKRERIRKVYDEAYEIWYGHKRKVEAFASALHPGDLRGGVIAGCSIAIVDLEIAVLDHGRPMIDKQLICTSLMEGRPLSLKLPRIMFKEGSTIALGVVQRIEIHNT